MAIGENIQRHGIQCHGRGGGQSGGRIRAPKQRIRTPKQRIRSGCLQRARAIQRIFAYPDRPAHP